MILKKRAILYFFILGFPMGLGAGAASWLQLPEIPLLSAAALFAPPEGEATPPEPIVPEAEDPSTATWDAETGWSLDFGALHPLTVAAFSLLFCSGVLLAADRPSPAAAAPPEPSKNS